MAIERPIPKDIRKYDAKLVGPFTTRQIACLVPGCALGALTYITLSRLISNDIAGFACMVIAMPWLLVGWYKPYGIPLEQFIRTVFITVVLAPKTRLYKIKNRYLDFRDLKSHNTKHSVKAKTALPKSSNPDLQAYL